MAGHEALRNHYERAMSDRVALCTRSSATEASVSRAGWQLHKAENSQAILIPVL